MAHKFVTIRGSREDHREIAKYTPWPSGEFHADTSFEINRELVIVSQLLFTKSPADIQRKRLRILCLEWRSTQKLAVTRPG